MILEFDRVSFRYPGDDRKIFEDLSFSIDQGEFVSLIGASGSGKSTIFRLVNGFNHPDQGSIRLHGTDTSGENRKGTGREKENRVRDAGGEKESGPGNADRDKESGTRNVGRDKNKEGYNEHCGYMPQNDLLFPWNTVLDNVALPLRVQKVPKEERREIARGLMARVGLGGYEDKYPRELSGGMRQRAAFARTLAAGSGLLLLDEPFSALDSITRASMQEWMHEQWSAMDKTILMVTHDVEEALFLSGRILVLTGRPVRNLSEVRVPLPAKRTRDMLLRGEILSLKQKLINMLQD